MKLLFIGDVVGKTGCDYTEKVLPEIKRKYGADITVINGENSAVGNGISEQSAIRLLRSGADAVTTGNHAYQKNDCETVFAMPQVIRPVNYPEGCTGKGIYTIDMGHTCITIVNLMGTVFMEALDNPFFKMDEVLKNMPSKNIFVDFHAEATSEKKAMGHYLAGRVTAVLGTHTHVQTADETILKGHTAYITDVGMTGSEKGILGLETETAISRIKYHVRTPYTEASGKCFLCGVIVTFDHNSGKAESISRIVYGK